jgi:hypothetical protein
MKLFWVRGSITGLSIVPKTANTFPRDVLEPFLVKWPRFTVKNAA